MQRIEFILGAFQIVWQFFRILDFLIRCVVLIVLYHNSIQQCLALLLICFSFEKVEKQKWLNYVKVKYIYYLIFISIFLILPHSEFCRLVAYPFEKTLAFVITLSQVNWYFRGNNNHKRYLLLWIYGCRLHTYWWANICDWFINWW